MDLVRVILILFQMMGRYLNISIVIRHGFRFGGRGQKGR